MWVPPIVKRTIDELGIGHEANFSRSRRQRRRRSRTSACKRKWSQAESTQRGERVLVTGQGQFLLQALAAAVDVAAATERYPTACGLDLQLTSEDLCKIGLSIYATGAK